SCLPTASTACCNSPTPRPPAGRRICGSTGEARDRLGTDSRSRQSDRDGRPFSAPSMRMTCAGLEDKPAVAIGAFHEILHAHFQIDGWMAQRPANAFTGDFVGLDFNDFGRFDGHGNTLMGWNGGDNTS